VLAWEDGRSGLGSDIYAQRVTAAGVVGPTVDVSDGIASAFRLSPPSPNPSAGGTMLSLTLPYPQRVTAEVFGIDGRRIRSLAQDEPLTAGTHGVAWDGRDGLGGRVSAGIYLVRVKAESGSGIAKLTMIR